MSHVSDSMCDDATRSMQVPPMTRVGLTRNGNTDTERLPARVSAVAVVVTHEKAVWYFTIQEQHASTAAVANFRQLYNHGTQTIC